MKCLIVEDDRISSRVLEKMISSHGIFDTVANGRNAVEQFQQAHGSNTPYDLILMDIMMPEVDGLQSVREIRKIEEIMNIHWKRGVKIIMVTTLSDPSTVAKALFESDANSYLVKPVTGQKLGSELRRLKLIS